MKTLIITPEQKQVSLKNISFRNVRMAEWMYWVQANKVIKQETVSLADKIHRHEVCSDTA